MLGHIRFKLLPLMAFAAISGAVLSCAPKAEPETPDVALSLSIKTPTVAGTKGACFVVVTAPGEWTLGFEEETDWAELSVLSGKGNKSNVQLSWTKNAGEKTRTCTIVLADSKDTVKAVFSQDGTDPQMSDELKPDPVANWMELPAVGKGLYFFSHPMTMPGDSKVLRNYSYAWDIRALVAHWVAYPLNDRLKSGGCGRSDKWGLDPKVPEKYQPVIYSAFKGNWARGHQIPSADRQVYNYNIQTFYGTNMTPQNYNMNSGIWSTLENKVRTWSSSFDTLYVVTGCSLEDSPGTSQDNNGKSVTVPGSYFKALLGYKKSGTIGKTGAQSGYTSIAFSIPNRDVSGDLIKTYSMTVEDLEREVGIDFFVNLPAAVGDNTAKKIESTTDNWWK